MNYKQQIIEHLKREIPKIQYEWDMIGGRLDELYAIADDVHEQLIRALEDIEDKDFAVEVRNNLAEQAEYHAK